MCLIQDSSSFADESRLAGSGASALVRRASPVTDAAATHVLIHPVQDTTLSIMANGSSLTSPTVLSPCNQGINISQIWDVNPTGGNVVQFQNVGNNRCFVLNTNTPTNGFAITSSLCIDSINGNLFSGAVFHASQAITHSKLPLVVTALNNQVGTLKDTGFCLDRAGNAVVINACNGGLSQSWLMTAP
ncbi:hypothetical protein B0H16DRAFT_1756824 [Mycena metata]|uniref:Ricin B lectin domain-containing protein n=1 Tax=Mycena metata TaxID=1033252 RepID=A0AAD7K053_9AGAR|nr:hypothetical protein B0H16DRAFT_1756824 [Mycena metata]